MGAMRILVPEAKGIRLQTGVAGSEDDLLRFLYLACCSGHVRSLMGKLADAIKAMGVEPDQDGLLAAFRQVAEQSLRRHKQKRLQRDWRARFEEIRLGLVEDTNLPMTRAGVGQLVDVIEKWLEVARKLESDVGGYTG